MRSDDASDAGPAWRGPAGRPAGPPALGWELPAGQPPLATEAAAVAALAADEGMRIAWMRRPGDSACRTVYEMPAWAEAVAARDARALAVRRRQAGGQALMWGGLAAAIALVSAHGGGGPSGLLLIVAMLGLPSLLGWWELHRLHRLLRRDWGAYAALRRDAALGDWWQAGRDAGRGLVIGLMLAIGVVAMGGLVAQAQAAGCVQRAAVAAGEWWRLLSGPILHGSIIHAGMNLLALLWLGTWAARLLGRAVIAPTLVAGMLAGDLCSMAASPVGSVGLSGGLMALVGLLGVAAWRWGGQAPPGMARTVAINLLLVASVGIIGIGYVDNAAHAGGALAGALLGLRAVPAAPGPVLAGPRWRLASRAALLVLAAAIAAAAWVAWQASAAAVGR